MKCGRRLTYRTYLRLSRDSNPTCWICSGLLWVCCASFNLLCVCCGFAASKMHNRSNQVGHGPDILHVHPPTTLPDKIFKHCGPLNMKSTGNSNTIGLHYPFGSNVGPHPQNAKFLPIPCRNFGPHFDFNFCGSLWFSYYVLYTNRKVFLVIKMVLFTFR